MSAGSATPLRIALLHHAYRSPALLGVDRVVRDVAQGLRDAGHEPCVVTSHVGPTHRGVENGIAVIRSTRLPEALLRRRGFDGPLTHIPLTLRELMRGGFDVANALSPPDTCVALMWRRLGGGPVVFTCPESPGREALASRRLRLALLASAVEDTDAVIAPTEESRAGLWRWLAVDAAVIEPQDTAGHVRLYRDLLPRGR